MGSGAAAKKKNRQETLDEVRVLVGEGRGEAVVTLIERLLDENTRLELLYAKLRKHRFGSKSERLDPQQLALIEAELDAHLDEPPERTPDHVIDEGQPRPDTAETKPPRKRGPQALYAIERSLKQEAVSPEVRAKVRQEQAPPILAELRAWLDSRRDRWPPSSLLSDAIGYTLNQWVALSVYLEDGQLEIDNTRVERLMRMVAVGRKNYLFAGSDDGARHGAVHYTLIATCRLHGIDPYAYLADVYYKLADAWPQRRLAELLPDAWARAHPDAPRSPSPA